MASIKLARSFITGSHAYGTPEHDSDVDLVIFTHEADIELLSRISDDSLFRENNGYDSGRSLRFGRLNIIAISDEKHFELWRWANKRLKARRPVDRDYAILYLNELRVRNGILYPENKSTQELKYEDMDDYEEKERRRRERFDEDISF